ncbi:putative toxin-antitoxin system toxin component, PIN family [Aphanizomenon flos-aquae NRERC-008]|uniref:Toxin-antitoxin system toxin component, PIN family n=1 Tax=Aphanizomenon flos-aquae FACHB-1249 TaxID=2692889 RepID=A0ABR8IUI8_APHFL|nr:MULTISPECIES: putative toxin-antitoxin system toxin component, PIN family [Aphanizomenon]MBD2391773.1 putative toxin-antitoxin system toxin component, PIN family [Aphanizomenon flos-aquae FACHB-1171]MBD2558303.1 putative toxin-antitoxin system toxin component, PIN family [Aphanizomenon flos-aquae FACHB-1290]MBD2632682.1 putative toxin-antitoxin system toxin component, PIN family [Aphanizomenon sp. FACHB-1399]MBD2643501.1 putative toxin-antitoxin system toxin component, PIN family [Aphanizome
MKTNRIVIDTNVIVSALIFSKSTTMQALREAKQNGVILISVEILSELIDVLSRPKFDRYLSREIREDFLASLARETELITINAEVLNVKKSLIKIAKNMLNFGRRIKIF